MEQKVLTLHSDQCSWPWYVLGPVREITLCVLVTSFHELLLSLTFSPHNQLLYPPALTVVVISTYSHFQEPGPISDPCHISLSISPSSHKLVTLYITLFSTCTVCHFSQTSTLWWWRHNGPSSIRSQLLSEAVSYLRKESSSTLLSN